MLRLLRKVGQIQLLARAAFVLVRIYIYKFVEAVNNGVDATPLCVPCCQWLYSGLLCQSDNF